MIGWDEPPLDDGVLSLVQVAEVYLVCLNGLLTIREGSQDQRVNLQATQFLHSIQTDRPK